MSMRPLAVHHGFGGHLGGIDNEMLHLLALPGVGDVDESIAGLDDGRIAEFLLRLVFENQCGFPCFAIFADGEVQRAAAFGGVVVNEEVAAVMKGDGIGAGVWIGQCGEGDIAPGFASVVGGDLEDLLLACAAHGLEFIATEVEDTRLNGADGKTVVQQFGAAPRFTKIAGALEVDGPRAGFGIGLVARWAEDVAIRKLHRLVLDGAEDTFRQLLGQGPCRAAIIARLDFSPPGARR